MWVQSKISIFIAVMCLALGLSVTNTRAFSLLGPVQPWMQSNNGVIYPGDIGGPMSISNGYRWNVPVVTYGFDKSFLDYFGTNGVAAVESAIQILNNLPPASQIVLTNYPLETAHMNFAAQAQSLYDLKSQALSTLLEQLGLAGPTRYIFVLRQWNSVLTNTLSDGLLPDVFEGTNISNYVVSRNYDPQNLNASPYINETLYSGIVTTSSDQSHYISPFVVDPLADAYNAVADNNLAAGVFYNGLTEDDIGGLAYLLSTNNVNYETLLSGVVGAGTNANSFVNGAWRPGVDKITFIPHPADPLWGIFLPMTNYFTDSYVTNDVLNHQQMARVISQPDFVFSAGDVTLGIPAMPFFTRTGTTNWANDAAANGNTNSAGPGVIRPQVQIVFNKLGRQFVGGGSVSDEQVFDQSQFFGSFDGSTTSPIYYSLPQAATNQLTVRMWLVRGTYPNSSAQSFEWKPTSAGGDQFTLQTSTNLTSWINLFTVTNDGSVCTYFNYNPASPRRFYRLVSQ